MSCVIKYIAKNHILVYLNYTKTKKKILKRVNILKNIDYDNIYDYDTNYIGDTKGLCLTQVAKIYDDSLQRMQRFEEKSKVNLIAISISVSAIFSLSSYLNTFYNSISSIILKYFMYMVSILIISYMILGGILALEVLADLNIAYKVFGEDLLLKRNKLKKIYSQDAELNENYNSIRNNAINASYRCIKNSLILLLIIFCINLFPNIKNSNNNLEVRDMNSQIQSLQKKTNNLSIENKHIQEKINEIKNK